MTNILHPEFSWHRAPTIEELRKRLSVAPTTPPLRRVAPFWFQRIVGFIHKRLITISSWYCRWYGIPCPGQIWQLPFGLLLKYSDGTRIEEVVATRAAYDAGLPLPRIISYGAQPSRMAPMSILMTRLPGSDLFFELWEYFTPEGKQTIIQQLKDILHFIHAWGRHPSAKSSAICSITGTSIRSHRLPFKLMQSCSDEAEFNRRLIEPADSDFSDFEDRMRRVDELHSLKHDIVFTHGDIAPQNIMVSDDGYLTGLIDWEAAGYYPNYWEYTTAWRVAKHGWWFDIVQELASTMRSERLMLIGGSSPTEPCFGNQPLHITLS